jgi:hypothetical protein
MTQVTDERTAGWGRRREFRQVRFPPMSTLTCAIQFQQYVNRALHVVYDAQMGTDARHSISISVALPTRGEARRNGPDAFGFDPVRPIL